MSSILPVFPVSVSRSEMHELSRLAETSEMTKTGPSAPKDLAPRLGFAIGSFTLFQVMTLEGWPTVARLAMAKEPWTWSLGLLGRP